MTRNIKGIPTPHEKGNDECKLIPKIILKKSDNDDKDKEKKILPNKKRKKEYRQDTKVTSLYNYKRKKQIKNIKQIKVRKKKELSGLIKKKVKEDNFKEYKQLLK